MSVGNHNIDIAGPDGKHHQPRLLRHHHAHEPRRHQDGAPRARPARALLLRVSIRSASSGCSPTAKATPTASSASSKGSIIIATAAAASTTSGSRADNPLAPPCRGGAPRRPHAAHALLRRRLPAGVSGQSVRCNWGRHGFAGPNRGIFRFVLDERNNIVKKETLVACTDPHFRPSHIHLDLDGSLLIADWYGRDDESDMTGRIWRLKYVGKDRAGGQAQARCDGVEE